MVFCESCRDEVSYSTKNITMTSSIKGWMTEYGGKLAYCDICESEVFIPEIRDYNLKMLERQFNKTSMFKNGLK